MGKVHYLDGRYETYERNDHRITIGYNVDTNRVVMARNLADATGTDKDTTVTTLLLAGYKLIGGSKWEDKT
jgi:hypothetical protein